MKKKKKKKKKPEGLSSAWPENNGNISSVVFQSYGFIASVAHTYSYLSIVPPSPSRDTVA